ncbi:MAG: AMP-dependent synthetase, partial [Oscillospiraceae bacterium]|nr:AMP-dependent synthetase [Oscillospiraceae bacterium]
MKLAFSSLGCPDLSWQDMANMAKDVGFHGIELRGYEDTPSKELFDALKKLQTGKLEISCVSGASSLQYPERLKEALAEAERAIALANLYDAP